MTEDVLSRLKTALADRYAIEREIGRGGMATVYLAKDLKHRRKVAVKVLRPELAESLAAERFLREVEVTAQLNHPHVLPLLDSGAADGFLYYVMPYIEGETLRDRIAREGQLPLEDALQITREIAAALSYAHSRGVIHRDIKPENVLLSAAEAVVADFGIARAVSDAGGERLTQTGLAVGTPAYMSPEQASGEGRLDGRSDIYALGCVLYEMLSGETPYTAPTPQALMAKKLSEPTPRISVVRETVPSAVEAALMKSLAKTPADRFITAQQFVEALETPSDGIKPATQLERVVAKGGKERTRRRIGTLVSAVAVAVVAVLLFQLGWLGGEAAPGEDVVERLVVAPLVNRTGDSAAADWAFMAAEFITRTIDRTGVVTVVPASTVRDLVSEVDPSEGMTLAEIARRTSAVYAVAGSYSVAAGRVRFDVELVNTESGELVRALEPVTGPVDSMEATAALLAEHVTAAAVALLSPELDPVFAAWSSPPSLEVVRSLLATQDLFCRSRWQGVIEQAQPGLEAAPDFAPLLVMVLFAYGNTGRLREVDSILTLIEPLSDRLTTSERVLVEWFHGLFFGDPAEETRAAEQLFRIQPGNFGYHAGFTANRANRFADALERLLAQDLDTPCYHRWYPWWHNVAQAYHMLGRYEEELAIALDGRERFPQEWSLLHYQAVALGGLGRLDDVDSLFDVIAGLPVQPGYSPGQQTALIGIELKALGHQDAYEAAMERALAWFAARPPSELRFWRGRAFYYAERWSDADTLFAALIDGAPNNVDFRGYRAVTLAHLNRRDEALEIDRWLERVESPFPPGGHTRWRAAIAVALGDRPRAVQLLEQAIQEGLGLGYYHHRDPEWETLRDYRPYQELMRAR